MTVMHQKEKNQGRKRRKNVKRCGRSLKRRMRRKKEERRRKKKKRERRGRNYVVGITTRNPSKPKKGEKPTTMTKLPAAD